MKDQAPRFGGGTNIAIKIPKNKFDDTVHFYKEILRLPQKGIKGTSHIFQFGHITLWLDKVDNYSQTDVWLETVTNDTEKAITYLEKNGVKRRDEIEQIEDIDAHWISDPAGVIHLLIKEPTKDKDAT